MNEKNKARPDVYQMVTDRIITALEKGIVQCEGLPEGSIPNED